MYSFSTPTIVILMYEIVDPCYVFFNSKAPTTIFWFSNLNTPIFRYTTEIRIWKIDRKSKYCIMNLGVG